MVQDQMLVGGKTVQSQLINVIPEPLVPVNLPPEDVMLVVHRDPTVINHHNHLDHRPAAIWTVAELPCQPAGSTGMNVVAHRDSPLLIGQVPHERRIAG